MSDDFNMSMRKFLKQVGVTSQQAIEDALRNSPKDAQPPFTVEAVIRIPALGLEHVITGDLKGDQE